MPRGSNFLLLRQKQVTKEKATPTFPLIRDLKRKRRAVRNSLRSNNGPLHRRFHSKSRGRIHGNPVESIFDRFAIDSQEPGCEHPGYAWCHLLFVRSKVQMEFLLRNSLPDQKWREHVVPVLGETVCYMESLRYYVLSKLMTAISETRWNEKFYGKYYSLKSKSTVIRDEYPASEYYKISQRSLTQKFHAIDLTLESIESRAAAVGEKYRREKKLFPQTQQPYIEFGAHLYLLRADYASLLFLIRAVLDEFAHLLQFICGPESNQVKSFSDVMKWAEKSTPHQSLDAEMTHFLVTQGRWFWIMRDVRDYFSHNGFVDLNLVDVDGHLKIYFNHRLDLQGTAAEFVTGLHKLFEFLDTHYATKISRTVAV